MSDRRDKIQKRYYSRVDFVQGMPDVFPAYHLLLSSIFNPSIFASECRRKVNTFVDHFTLVVSGLFSSTGVFEHHVRSTCIYKTGRI